MTNYNRDTNYIEPSGYINKKTIGVVIILLLLLISVSILNVIGHKEGVLAYEVLRSILEFLYFSCSVLLVIGLFIGYKQLLITIKDIDTRNERIAKEKALDFLEVYANTTLPKINDYRDKYSNCKDKKSDEHFIDVAKHLDNDFVFKLEELHSEQGVIILRELIKKQELGLVDIFNHLESLSATIVHNIASEEVVYPPIAKVFCSFIKAEIVFLSAQRGQGVPFENTVKLYKQWSSKMEYDANNLKIKELQDKINSIEESVAATK